MSRSGRQSGLVVASVAGELPNSPRRHGGALAREDFGRSDAAAIAAAQQHVTSVALSFRHEPRVPRHFFCTMRAEGKICADVGSGCLCIKLLYYGQTDCSYAATEVSDDSRNQRHRPGFRSADHRRQNSLSRLDRRQLGGAVFAPEGFHAGLHHRARLHGEDQAGVRQARRQDHRAVASIRSTSTPAGPPTSRRRKASRRTIR